MNQPPAATPVPILSLDALAVGYDRRAILPALSLEVRSGELWALVGPNGCGKSTLLRTLLNLQPAVAGRMAWGPQARIGYVPQRTRLDPSMPARVLDVVRSGLDRAWSFLNPLHARRHADAIARAMRDTHTAELAAQPFGQLSEGQKQRVLMARALVGDPAVLVLDEPTSAMDMRAEHDTFALIECLRHDRELAVLLVSHHLPVVAEFATHVMLLDRDADALLAGPIAELADHPGCRARYGSILQEGIARRARHLCALSEDELDHVHDHNHHPHAHHHEHHHDALDHDHHDHHHDHHHHH